MYTGLCMLFVYVNGFGLCHSWNVQYVAWLYHIDLYTNLIDGVA